MLDIRKLKELIRLMVENELTEIDLKDEKETVSLRRGSQAPVVQVSPTHPRRRLPGACHGLSTCPGPNGSRRRPGQ